MTFTKGRAIARLYQIPLLYCGAGAAAALILGLQARSHPHLGPPIDSGFLFTVSPVGIIQQQPLLGITRSGISMGTVESI
ncbi:hypothetical protein [Microcoleus sp. bin38.metabat.b11b12b14.051]|uniref:hypothetical protein n=1 Tax=Microcoleus sp. bin38.metabat.b11b12b14.051 TaxID=2742709 RepID=UPI0025DEE611|nr:hypothetical protein [Microcoleus sp. bin38.metabat.b11b12b14.051]